MRRLLPAAVLLALAAPACDNSLAPVAPSDAGTTDATEAVDAAAVDAANIDASTSPIADAAPAPDAIPGFTCASPVLLGAGQSHLGDTENFINANTASCSPGTASSKDTVYRVPLPAVPTDLIANLRVDLDQSPPFDAVLSIQSECGNALSEQACSDFGFSESVEALGLTNEAFIVVDGTEQFGGANSGPYQLDVATRAIVTQAGPCDPQGITSRCELGFLCAGATCQPETAALACTQAAALVPGVILRSQSHAFAGDLFQGSCAFDAATGSGEALFAVHLDQDSNIDITTDFPGTGFDTVIYLLASCTGSELACADDVDASLGNFRSHLQANAVPAGDYLVVVDGSSSAAPVGAFSIRLNVDPL